MGYEGYGEMVQKAIEGDMSHVKSYAWEIEIAHLQNGWNYRSRGLSSRWLIFSVGKNPRWLKITEPSRFFSLKKWAVSAKNTWSRFGAILNVSHLNFVCIHTGMTSRETCLLRWLFEPSHHTPIFLQRQSCQRNETFFIITGQRIDQVESVPRL